MLTIFFNLSAVRAETCAWTHAATVSDDLAARSLRRVRTQRRKIRSSKERSRVTDSGRPPASYSNASNSSRDSSQSRRILESSPGPAVSMTETMVAALDPDDGKTGFSQRGNQLTAGKPGQPAHAGTVMR